MYRPHIKKEGNSVQNKYLSPKISLHNTTRWKETENSNLYQMSLQWQLTSCSHPCETKRNCYSSQRNLNCIIWWNVQLTPWSPQSETKRNCYGCPRNLNCIIWWNVQFNGIQNHQTRVRFTSKIIRNFYNETINESGK